MRPEDQPNGEAERLLNHPLIVDTLDQLESEANEAAIDTDDMVARDNFVREVRVIRELRRKLKTLAEGKTTPPKPRAVA
ncbi:MAG: hypothetical protein JJ979_24720 [Roseibium sp.]|nr:hypothetical protein [Roseibium sp.]